MHRDMNIESIVYRYDRDREAFQKFIGAAPWEHQLVEKTLICEVIERQDGKLFTGVLDA